MLKTLNVTTQEGAPFSLTDYETAAEWSSSGGITYMVSNGYMPPWPPDSTYQNYAHERGLPIYCRNKQGKNQRKGD